MTTLPLSPIRVKICGLTKVEDALHAAASGADYLGFIMYPASPRAISPASVRQITDAVRAALPTPPLFVGVFVNETAATVAQQMDEAGLDLAQLQGDEVPWMVGSPESPLYGRCYKGLRPQSLAEAEADIEWYLPPERAEHQPAILLDAYHPHMRGGTGHTIDWEMAQKVAESTPGLFLAGGLTPNNVAAAASQVQPFGVDVASGVELSPGVKNQAKVAAFIAAAKQTPRL